MSRTPGKWSVMATLGDKDVGTMEEKARWAYSGGGKVFIMSESDCDAHPIADCSCNHSCRGEAECEANAAYIVKCVNEREALLKVLEDLNRMSQRIYDCMNSGNNLYGVRATFERIANEAAELLAKAQA